MPLRKDFACDANLGAGGDSRVKNPRPVLRADERRASHMTRRAYLLADAESAEDLAEQIVGGKIARDGRKRLLCEPQLLGEDFPAPDFAGCRREVRGGLLQSAQVPLAG